MKLIRCVVPESKLEKLQTELLAAGITNMTCYEVKGFSANKLLLQQKAKKCLVEFKSQLMLEVVLADNKVMEISNLMVKTAQSGRLSDGKIFILSVEEVIRLRTGESGESAL